MGASTDVPAAPATEQTVRFSFHFDGGSLFDNNKRIKIQKKIEDETKITKETKSGDNFITQKHKNSLWLHRGVE